VTFAKQYVRGERQLTDEQMEYVATSGKLERARIQVQKEDERARERVAKQAAKQRAREGEGEVESKPVEPPKEG
jgi:sRNA-binding protein